MDEHQPEERGEILGPVHPEDRQATYQMARGHELLGGKRAVGKLTGKENPHDRGDCEGTAHPSRLGWSETEATIGDLGAHVAPDERQPRTPNRKFQNHHQPETKRRSRSGGVCFHARQNRRCVRISEASPRAAPHIGQSAIHANHLRGDPALCRIQEPGDRPGHVFGLP